MKTYIIAFCPAPEEYKEGPHPILLLLIAFDILITTQDSI